MSVTGTLHCNFCTRLLTSLLRYFVCLSARFTAANPSNADRVASFSTTFEGKQFHSLGALTAKDCKRVATPAGTPHRIGGTMQAGEPEWVGEGNPNGIVREIIEYLPNVDDNVPFPSTLEQFVNKPLDF